MFLNDVGEVSKHLITKEVFVTNENLKFTGWKNITDSLESSRTNLIQRNIELFHFLVFLKSLSDQGTTVISNDVSLDVQDLEGVVRFKTFGDPLSSCDQKFVIFDIEFLEDVGALQEFGQWLSHI